MTGPIFFPDISPEIFTIHLFGSDFSLRWYALAYIVGILLGWRLAVAALNRAGLWRGDTPPLTKQKLEDLLTWIIIGVIFGGRLGYVLFYQPSYYFAHPSKIPMVWLGGMSFHGGFLGVAIASTIYALRNKIELGKLFDMMALAAPIGLFFGRIANFINAELWGRPTDLPWGVVFPGEAAQNCMTLQVYCARHPSQLYEAALEGLILGALLLYLVFRAQSLKAPWRTTGVFLAGYGLSRFVVELVRQPDAQFVTPTNPLGLALQFGDYGLTMGQLLSLPMLLLGLGFVLYSARTK